MTKQIVKQMLITEKTLTLAETENKYTFIVGNKANKIEIAEEVAKKFNVKVISVNISNYLGKAKTFGKKRIEGKKPNYRKAVVTVKPGDSITEFNLK